MKIDSIREKHMLMGLKRSELDSDPIKQFESWYLETLKTEISEPSAMVLATVDETGQAWQRTVLLKLFDANGFVFFSNYSSRKAQQMTLNNRVSLLFPWHSLGRQIMITGVVEKVSTRDSLKYFLSRPRGSQLGAWASHQSQVIKNRALLDGVFNEIKNKFKQGEIPLPSFWGGYRIKPDSIEFWQARESRLHDRFIYNFEESTGWIIQRLAP